MSVWLKFHLEVVHQVLAMAYSRTEWWRDSCSNLTAQEEAELRQLWKAYQVCDIQCPSNLFQPTNPLKYCQDHFFPSNKQSGSQVRLSPFYWCKYHPELRNVLQL